MRKNAKKFVTLKCANCEQLFEKELKEYNRRSKNGQTVFYCGYGCSYPSLAVNKPDEFSQFRSIFFSSQKTAKVKGFGFNLTLEFLKSQWLKQEGRCPYTNIQMELPRVMRDRVHSLNAASLDRIDSDLGYVQGNVEFVCRFVNLGKNGYSKEEVQKFFKMVGIPDARL